MQLQGVRVSILITFFSILTSFGQSETYRLKVIDSVSYEISCLHYFEFKKGGKIYKVISEDYSDTLEPTCLSTFEISKKYCLSLYRIYWIDDQGIWIDLLKTRVSSNSRTFGGLEKPVYMCDAIFRDKVNCACIIEKKRKK